MRRGGASLPATQKADASDYYLRIIRPLGAAYLLVGAGLRLSLWGAIGRESNVGSLGLLTALTCGAVNDLVQLAYLLVPLTLVLLVLPARFTVSRPGRFLIGLLLYAAIAVALFVAVAEFLFFEEFDSRFNLVAVDYLIYPTEVFGNIEESYPVRSLLAVIAATRRRVPEAARMRAFGQAAL